MEAMITDGRITVNGEPAHIGQRISFGDRIALDGKPVRYRIASFRRVSSLHHKPAFARAVTHDDPQPRPDQVPAAGRGCTRAKRQSVGRLDINTEGLLLFTTS
ncbi:MAG: 23S rRNA pseudouridylate synthase B, partial [Betaproteobacteria bacterium]|nr:23S rRNA pseudouridylate synthase B [Betaproteobacteria bacterium]